MYTGVSLYGDGRLKLPTRESLLDKEEVAKSISRINSGLPVAYVANYVKDYPLNRTAGLQIMTFGHLTCGTKIGVLINGIKLYVDVLPMDIIRADFDNEEKALLLEMDREGVTDERVAYSRVKDFPMFRSFAKKANTFAKTSHSINMEIIYKKIFNIGFQPTFVGYRIYYNSVASLRNAVYEKDNIYSAYMCKELFVASYSTSNIADLVGARQDKYFGSWMALTKYTKISGGSDGFSKLKYNLLINVNDYVKVTDFGYERLGITSNTLNICKSVHLSIDIETADVGKVEDIKSENINKGILSESNAIFNIGCVVALENSKPALRINIINTQAKPYVIKKVYKELAVPGQLTIVTTSCKETLEAFIKIVKELMPDFVYGYNSLDFDIPQLLLSLRYYNLFDLFYEEVSLARSDSPTSYKHIYKNGKFEYRHNESGYTHWSNISTTSLVSGISGSHKYGDVKLKLNNAKLPSLKIKQMMKNYHHIDIPGIIMLDVMLISWKQYPGDNNKGGMNYYLTKNKMKVKLDMPYYKIWLFYSMSAEYDICAIPTEVDEKYYLGDKEIGKAVYDAMDGLSLLASFQLIVEYCSYDAEAAMLLINTYNYMSTKRKFCELVNLPLERIINRADGSKVENSLRRTLTKNNYVFIEECLNMGNTEGFSAGKIKRIIDTNPNMLHYHIKQKAPKNTGGHVEIHRNGRIKVTFIVDGKPYLLDIPIDALDFASLYPSIMMAFNLCYTTIILDVRIVDYVRKYMPDIKIHEMSAAEIVAESDFPNEMNEYYSRYYNVASFKDSTIYILQHSNEKSKYGIFAQNMGAFFDARGKTKANMKEADDNAGDIIMKRITDKSFIKLHDEHRANGGKLNIKEFAEKYSLENDSEYVNYKITHCNENLSQLCVKVAMNTVYGTLDYVDSPIYSPLIASIITFYARRYLKHSNDFCIKHGRTPVYNDTDSTYYYHPLEIFQSTVEKYVRGQITKKEFDRKMVHKSIKNSCDTYSLKKFYEDKIKLLTNDIPEDEIDHSKIERLKAKIANIKPGQQFADLINKSFAEKSGGPFLKQVREETLYPAVFCMLKKYFGLVHTTKYVDKYSINDILFRGIKIRVANVNKFEKNFTWDIIRRIIDEDSDIRDIVFQQLDNLFNYQVDYNDLSVFENVARYKSKGGKADLLGMIKRFERTRNYVGDPKLQYLLRTPFELENVYYVFVRNNEPYTITGLVNNPKKQDLNEYSDVVKYIHAKNHPLGLPYMEIDLLRYIAGTASTCAQLLSYDKSFGYIPGMKNKDYVRKIAKYVVKYCKDRYAESISAAHEENKLYKKFIKDGSVFKMLIDKMTDCEVLRMSIERMIHLSPKLRYSEKLRTIAYRGHTDLNISNNDFYGDFIDQDYVDTVHHIQTLAESEFNDICDYIDYMRDKIINTLHNYVKCEFRNQPYEVIPLDEQLSGELTYCELVFHNFTKYTVYYNGIIEIFSMKDLQNLQAPPLH